MVCIYTGKTRPDQPSAIHSGGNMPPCIQTRPMDVLLAGSGICIKCYSVDETYSYQRNDLTKYEVCAVHLRPHVVNFEERLCI